MERFTSPAYRSRIETLMQQHHVPGFAAAFVHNGRVVSAGFGKASLETGREQDCTADTLFDIASCSKSLTAASIALLVEDDEKYPEIQWRAKMNDLLPEDFVMQTEEHTREIMLEDILSHRTGLPRHDSTLLGIRSAQPDTPRSVTRNLRNLPIPNPVRSVYIYSNNMFTVATHLLEVKTQRPFGDVLRTRFFSPLGMSSTHLQPGAAREAGLADRMAVGYHWQDDQTGYLPGIKQIHSPEAQGAGSIITSVNDYILYVKAMMNKETPFSEKSYTELTKARWVLPETDEDEPFTSPAMIALGWELYWYRGYKIVVHGGLIPGFASCHFFMPQLRFGGCLFTNSGGGEPVVYVVMKELIDELLEVPQDQRVDWNDYESRRAAAERDDGKPAEEIEEVRQQLCPGIVNNEPFTVPLIAYTGSYNNAGYHTFVVEEKDGVLFVDASDRSVGFTMRFEHVCEQTKFICHLAVPGESDEWFRAEFEMDSDGRKALRMGLLIDGDLDDLVWFDRVE